jgi:hypothetical protein
VLALTGERGEHLHRIDGKSGRVSFVRINGKTSGRCSLSVACPRHEVPEHQWPATRAEVDISI